MGQIPDTTITFLNIRDTFGGRENTNVIYFLDYMPGGMLSSNIDFSQDEEGGSKKIEILRGKGKMKISNVQYINVSPTVVRIIWEGSKYSSAKVIWPGGSSSIPYGVFTFDVPGMVPNSTSGITMTPVSSTDKKGANSVLNVNTLPSTLTDVTLTNVTTSGARVNWTGSGYTKVVVTWTGGGPSGYILSGTSFYDVSGLSSNSPYTFTVTPYNSINVAGTATNSTTITTNNNVEYYTFTSFTFSNAGTTGLNGPTLAVCKAFSTYAATTWASNTTYFNMTINGVQKWTVPASRSYSFIVAGARGGTATYNTKVGGLGRIVSGTVASLVKGDVLYIIIGQLGQDRLYQAGGAGGTFVFLNNVQLASALFVGGGGGGATHNAAALPLPGNTLTNGNTAIGTGSGTGGVNGGGGVGGAGGYQTGTVGETGSSVTCTGGKGGTATNGMGGAGGGGGGGGIYSVSSTSTFLGNVGGTKGVVNDSVGGIGGFGGGGSGGVGNLGGGGGGGGGGYSGGGGGGGGAGYSGGGGGGSYIISTATATNTNYGTNTGHGYVIITAA